MAFSSAITGRSSSGKMHVTRGTYNCASVTGGDIDTGLSVCHHIKLQPTGATASASAPVINETLPVAGSAVTIVTVSGEVGLWEAHGYY